jgi:hypothetical protein
MTWVPAFFEDDVRDGQTMGRSLSAKRSSAQKNHKEKERDRVDLEGKEMRSGVSR